MAKRRGKAKPPSRREQQAASEPLNENWFHWVQSEFAEFLNPDTISIETYLEMLKDETVFAGVEFLRRSVMARLGEFSCPVKRAEKLVRETLVQIDGGFLKSTAQMFSTAMRFGSSATEKIWVYENGRYRLKGLQTLHPATVSYELHTSGPDKNRLKCVYQYRRQGLREKALRPELEKVVVYTHNEEWGNIYGTSRLRSVYAAWFTKKVIVPAWGLMMERFGTPLAIGQTDASKDVIINGRKMSAREALGMMLARLGSKGSMVTDLNTKVEIVQPAAGSSGDFDLITTYCNKMIFRGLGLPSLIADHGSVGSQALGKEHSSTFKLLLEELGYEFAATLVDQVAKPIIKLNLGEQKLGYGEFAIENFDVESAKMLAEYFDLLLKAGIMRKGSLDDMNEVRSQLGLSLWTEADMEEGLSVPNDSPPTPEPEDETTEDADEEASPEEKFARSELALCFSLAGKRKAKAALAAARAKRSQQKVTFRRSVGL